MADSTDNSSIRQEIEKAFSQISQVIHSSLRPLPTETGDGSYIETTSSHTGILRELGNFGIRDIETLIDVTRNAATGQPVDDRRYILERVIQASQGCGVKM
jgi:linoleate 8R-lipoxygenase/9,12-octadecadienoate 8-hydroperoxide 8R-isomerase